MPQAPASPIDGERQPLLAASSPSPSPETFTSSLRAWPSAVLWSAFVSLGVIMLAFDPQLLGNLFATPQFRKDFGHPFGSDNTYIISAPWQTALSMGNPLGQVVGALFAAYPMDMYGR